MAALLRVGSSGIWLPGQVKPQGVPRIDWSHPLTAGLVFYGFDTGQGLIVDLARGRPMQITAALPAVSQNQWGSGFGWNATSTAYFASDAEIRAASILPYTAACAYVETSAAAAGVIFGRTANNHSSSPFNNWEFYINPGGAAPTSASFAIDSGGSSQQIGSAWSGNPVGTYNVLAGVINGVSGSFYANGALIGTQSGLVAGSVNTNDAVLFAGETTGSLLYRGQVPWGAFWGRVLSQGELMSLYLDPYQFLLPPEGDSGIAR